MLTPRVSQQMDSPPRAPRPDQVKLSLYKALREGDVALINAVLTQDPLLAVDEKVVQIALVEDQRKRQRKAETTAKSGNNSEKRKQQRKAETKVTHEK